MTEQGTRCRGCDDPAHVAKRATHTEDCAAWMDYAARVTASVNGWLTSVEADAYAVALDSCPAEHPWH